MAAPDYAEYLDQLARLPGGPAAALRDYLGPCLAGPEQRDDLGLPTWPLAEGDCLCLRSVPEGGGLRLLHISAGQTTEIARFGEDLLTAAKHHPHVSPLVLALLAIAAGDVDDGRRLRQHLPRLDSAAKELMLMTLCRLCG